MHTVHLHDCKEELRGVELKATPVRLEILKLLEESDKPLDVSSIKEFLNKKKIKTDPVTVFRVVNSFTEKGITKQISFNEGKFRYELATKADHHHLICKNCGSIEDISDCNISSLEKDIEKKGFKVQSHSLEFFGECERCQL
jgi:Fe2+ or Zn2+ uptake regulation protein